MHTREAALLRHAANGSIDEREIVRGSWLLRDHREEQAVQMDPKLFDMLYVALTLFRSAGPVLVTSGYRSPRTNAMLAERFPGVARNSWHIQGRAIDFHVPGLDLVDVFRFLAAWGAGGVGYYPPSGSGSGWVHIDTGEPRWWLGGHASLGRRAPTDPGRRSVPKVPA